MLSAQEILERFDRHHDVHIELHTDQQRNYAETFFHHFQFQEDITSSNRVNGLQIGDMCPTRAIFSFSPQVILIFFSVSRSAPS